MCRIWHLSHLIWSSPFPLAHCPLATLTVLQLFKVFLSLGPLWALFPLPGMQTHGLSSHFTPTSSPQRWLHSPPRRAATPSSLSLYPISFSSQSLLPKIIYSFIDLFFICISTSFLLLCNKLWQTWWLKQYVFTLQSEMGLPGLNQGISRTEFLLEAVGETSFPCLFCLGEATCIAWYVSPSIFKVNTSRSSPSPVCHSDTHSSIF